MPIITLTTDWGEKDHYLASVKGALLKQLQDITIVDISHEIAPFNIKEAAFILKNSFRYFPEGTIHIIGVNTVESDENPHVALKIEEQYFIGSDNGIYSLIFNEAPDKIVELDIIQDSDYYTFSTRDRFIKAALHLASGKPMEDLGPVRRKIMEQMLFQPVVEKDVIKGMVIYIDNYENVITNITKDLFEKEKKNRKFKIVFRGEEINKISTSYSDVSVGEMLTLFGSNDHLEVAINQGNASGLLGLYIDDPVRVEFF